MLQMGVIPTTHTGAGTREKWLTKSEIQTEKQMNISR
jgi:hypothetical protein